ncbi:MAG: hypothetical protein K2M08_00025 [Anaeroplasmataceae bacterium]|nr:hypothetical protein [Anaeroplasmataceae bacterium]
MKTIHRRTVAVNCCNGGTIIDSIYEEASKTFFYTADKRQLSKILGQLPNVDFDVKKHTEIEGQSSKEEVRIVVTEDGNFSLEGYKKEDLSHYVLIKTKGSASTEYDWTIIIKTYEQGLSYIKAIYFDIVMFYYYCLNANFKTTSQKREFNLIKKDFLVNEGYKVSKDQTYVNFLCYFILENGFDFESYVKLWAKFVTCLRENNYFYSKDKLVIDTPISEPTSLQKSSISYAKAVIIARNVMENHEKRHQISERKLVAEIMKNYRGPKNYLIRIERRPHKKSKREELRQLMGLKQYGYGKICVVSGKKIHHLLQLTDFISIYELK